jgi:hypothetical protein
MILEKGKVYKIYHMFAPQEYGRDYIIFSPLDDVMLADDYFTEYNMGIRCESMKIFTLFTVCFSGEVLVATEAETLNPHGYSTTGIDRFSKLIPLTDKDYDDIRKVVDALGEGYKYNRKLNEIVYVAKNETFV